MIYGRTKRAAILIPTGLRLVFIFLFLYLYLLFDVLDIKHIAELLERSVCLMCENLLCKYLSYILHAMDKWIYLEIIISQLFRRKNRKMDFKSSIDRRKIIFPKQKGL